MVAPKQFIDALEHSGVTFFAGVPDSLLKEFLACVEKEVPRERHITAANEGNAIGIAAGYHLATGGVAAVYMQNSGLGNAVNPLTSLCDSDVYALPVLLIIGWRGEPNVKDEPQHKKQGKITEELLNVLGIPYVILAPEQSSDEVAAEVSRMAALAKTEGRPAALLVRSAVFESYVGEKPASAPGSMTRESAIEAVIESLGASDIVVSTTGKISRELYEARKRGGVAAGRDFMTVGSMGHAAQIALGIAAQKKDRPVWCLDGDGATIMHMGGLATVGWVQPKNFRHVVLNNRAHESVGGQRSAAEVIDLAGVAKSCGYAYVHTVAAMEELVAALDVFKRTEGPAFLEIIVNLQSRKDLSRPAETPQENKKAFMDFVHGTD